MQRERQVGHQGLLDDGGAHHPRKSERVPRVPVAPQPKGGVGCLRLRAQLSCVLMRYEGARGQRDRLQLGAVPILLLPPRRHRWGVLEGPQCELRCTFPDAERRQRDRQACGSEAVGRCVLLPVDVAVNAATVVVLLVLEWPVLRLRRT